MSLGGYTEGFEEEPVGALFHVKLDRLFELEHGTDMFYAPTTSSSTYCHRIDEAYAMGLQQVAVATRHYPTWGTRGLHP